MLNPQEVANFITDELNKAGAAWHDRYTFKVMSEIRDGTVGKADIQGILRTDSAEFVPVAGEYTEGKYVFSVDLPIPSARANYHFLQVKGIVEELIRKNKNISHAFTNGKGIFTFAEKKTGTYKVAYGTGETVTMSFSAFVTYTENAVTSADKHWFLDDVEIPFLSESVTLEREGTMRNYFNGNSNKVLLTGQTKYYNFQIPYESEAWGIIQKEILKPSIYTGNGATGKHTLKYYDGVSFTEDSPFTATVKIFRTAKSSSAPPNASTYDVTFTDTDSDIGSISYQLGLLDFPFDLHGEDTRYFNSEEEQQEYFENKIRNGDTPFMPIEAPNLDSLFITSQVYQENSPLVNGQFNISNKNYAVIKVTYTGIKNPRYFYYFITKSKICTEGKVLLDLQLDTVQTFFFDPDISFSDCLIERAHLNRFEPATESGGDYIRFISDPASKIFNAEEGMNFPKRLVSREKLNIKFTGNSVVDDWLNENVAYWVYVFIDPTAKYTVLRIPSGTSDENSFVNGSEGKVKLPLGLNGAASVFCYPIYKTVIKDDTNYDEATHVIKILSSDESGGNTAGFIPSEWGRKGFELNNNQSASYYQIKLSIIPPFDSGEGMSVQGTNLIMEATTGSGTYLDTACTLDNGERAIYVTQGIYDNKWGLFFGSNQTKKELETSDYSLIENTNLYKPNVIKAQAPNLTYNPKLNSQNFKELIITAANGDEFTYDIQKISAYEASFLYSEPIQPEITRYYMRLNPTGLYLEGTEENYTGLVGSTDNGLAFTTDQYAAFLANNKNFFMQSNLKIGIGAVKSTAGVISQAASGKIAGAVGSGLSAGLDIAQSLIDRSMTIDNMRSAPDQMKNANGNVLFNMFATDLGLYVEKYSALDGDLKTANDFINLYGFSFDSIANVKDYVHIRKYHNYVKAQLQGITGNISNTARDDLRQRFANGIRFWNQDEITYQYENYELWLED